MKKNKKAIYILIVLVLLITHSCDLDSDCDRQIIPFFDSPRPLRCIGSDSEIIQHGSYQSIRTYCLDSDKNVYIADEYNNRVDKFNSNGDYLFSFGGVNHESLHLPGWLEIFAVNSKGDLVSYCNLKSVFLQFLGNGKKFSLVDAPPELKTMVIKKLEYDRFDTLYILAFKERSGYCLLRCTGDMTSYSVIHAEKRQIRPSNMDMIPDFSFDNAGNCYITDTVDYRVFVYSPQGSLNRTFFKEMKKYRILESDSHYLVRPGTIRKLSGFEGILKKLSGPARFFPAIFGINIDRNRIYLWTASMDNKKRYEVDIYDLKFNLLFRTAWYNWMGNNLAHITNGQLYIPNIEPNDNEFKNDVGRLSLFSIPYKLEVFPISTRICACPSSIQSCYKE